MTREERHIAVLNRLLENMDVYDSIQPTEERKKAIKAAIQALSQEQKSKIGHWIEKDGFDGDVYYDCSVCGESWTTIEGTPWDNGMSFCPNCGAKMESEVQTDAT